MYEQYFVNKDTGELKCTHSPQETKELKGTWIFLTKSQYEMYLLVASYYFARGKENKK
jgi:hypothetical protein